jgi:DNA-binding protein HU-beta
MRFDMNKNDLVTAIALAAGLTKVDAAKAVDATIETITKSVNNGEKVTLPGFAIFEKVARPARKGRNPSNGQEIDIPAKNVVKIKTGKTLQDAVN